jgi:ketosteroid isomerase-like protein
MSDSALETVFDHFHARRRHDIEAVASGLEPDIVHQGVEPELVCNGRDEVLAMVRRSFARDGVDLDRIELVNAGERVVVGLAGPRFRENPFLTGELFILFTVRDGKIARMDDYRTRGEAFQAAGLTVPA